MSNNDGNKTVVNATLSDWEENMVDDLSQQFGVPGDIVLNIGITFLVNELSGSAYGKQSILNTIHKSNAANIPDVVDTDSVEDIIAH